MKDNQRVKRREDEERVSEQGGRGDLPEEGKKGVKKESPPTSQKQSLLNASHDGFDTHLLSLLSMCMCVFVFCALCLVCVVCLSPSARRDQLGRV